MTYEVMSKNAEHYLALGQCRVFIHGDDPSFPFEKVTSIEPGGCIRNGMHTGIYFVFTEGGLEYRHEVELEPRLMNGQVHSVIDGTKLFEIMDRLSFKAKQALCVRLQDMYREITTRINETDSYLAKQRVAQGTLKRLIMLTSFEE